MKRVILGAALAALTATAAYADQFAGIYGNTVHITRPDGTTAIVFVNEDKTWEQRTTEGKVMRGTFAWKDDTHVCFTVTDPKPEKPEDAESCDEVTGNHKAGDTWTEDDGKGHTTTIAVTAGRS
jgi:hypothetical protein